MGIRFASLKFTPIATHPASWELVLVLEGQEKKGTILDYIGIRRCFNLWLNDQVTFRNTDTLLQEGDLHTKTTCREIEDTNAQEGNSYNVSEK